MLSPLFCQCTETPSSIQNKLLSFWFYTKPRSRCACSDEHWKIRKHGCSVSFIYPWSIYPLYFIPYDSVWEALSTLYCTGRYWGVTTVKNLPVFSTNFMESHDLNHTLVTLNTVKYSVFCIFIALHLALYQCLLIPAIYLLPIPIFILVKTTWKRIAKFLFSVHSLASCMPVTVLTRNKFLPNTRWRLKKMKKEPTATTLQYLYPALIKKWNFPQILGNSDGSGCKVIYEEGLPNIWGNISPYMRRPLVIYGFKTSPFWISWYMRKIWFSFLSVYVSLTLPLLLLDSTFNYC